MSVIRLISRSSSMVGQSNRLFQYREVSACEWIVPKQFSYRKMATKTTVTCDNMNPNLVKLEYAVRGPIVIRAVEIEKEIEKGVKKPFTDVIRANIGDCHEMGQVPITFIRQVLALVAYPPLIDFVDFPSDVKERARQVLGACRGGSVGSYSASHGIEEIRKHCAEYIAKRDGIPSDWQNICLSSGASDAIKNVLKILIKTIDGKPPACMIPIPQYPLYSASLCEFGIKQVGYFLDEDKNWGLDLEEMERSITEAKKDSNPRAVVVINPGNPTGQVLSRENIEQVVNFAVKHNLVILADEVYQDNIYAPGSEFFSFKKVVHEMGARVELASFMSCSKGYMGECGIRGGYVELLNFDPEVQAILYKAITAMLCPNVFGQVTMDCVAKPPSPSEPSYDLFMKEKCEVLLSLKQRAEMVVKTFNSMEGFKCNIVQGAMYAMPRYELPPKAIAKAKEQGLHPDVYYAFQLLENAGVCIVPGSGFGQRPGTYHFRTTILPQTARLQEMLDRFKIFHEDFLAKHQ